MLRKNCYIKLKTLNPTITTKPASRVAGKNKCVCVCVSYIVVVHQLTAVTGQSAGQKPSCFDSCGGQLGTTLKQD